MPHQRPQYRRPRNSAIRTEAEVGEMLGLHPSAVGRHADSAWCRIILALSNPPPGKRQLYAEARERIEDAVEAETGKPYSICEHSRDLLVLKMQAPAH